MKKRIIIGIAIFFVALIVSGYFILTSSFALEKIRSIAESTVQDMFKREATIEGITGNPLSGISINGVSIAKNDKLNKGKILEIQTIKTKYSLLGLLKSKIVVNSIKIIQPRIWIEMDKNGKLNIPKFGKSRFTVLNAEINSGQVNFDDKRDSVRLTINDINGSLFREEDKEVKSKVEIKAVKAEFSLLNVTKHISEIVVFFETSGDTITLSNLELRTVDSLLWAKGELIRGNVPKLDANIKTKLALNDFKEFAPQFKRLDGIVDVNITAKGEMRDISSICKIDSKSLYVNDLKINNLKGNVKLSQKGVELPDISANIGGGKAGIKGSAKLTGGKLYGYKGDVRLSNLDTYNILSGLTSTKSPLSGILNGKILINGKELRPGAFQSKGDLELTDLSVKVSQNQNEPSLPQYKYVPIGNIKASLNVNGKSIAVNMSRDKTIMDVKGTLRDDAGLKLTMVLSGVDIAEMMSILVQPSNGRINLVPPSDGRISGSSFINGQGRILADASMKIVNPVFLASMGLKDGGQRGKIIKDIADLKGNVKINVPNLDIPIKNNEGQPSQVRIGSINGNIALDDDHVRTEDFALLLDNAKCLVKADVKIEKSPLVNARFTLDSLLIEKYAKLFGSNMPIHGGLINGEIGVSGKVTELNGSGEMLVSDLSVGTRNIDPIIIPITIQSNVLKIPELIISSVGEQIKTACEFRPSGDYTLKIDSSPIDITKLYKDVKSTPNDGVIISSEKAVTPGGKLQISLSGMGNFKFPYLDNKIKFDEIRYNGESFGNGECLINVGDKKVSLDMYSQDRILVANVDASIQKPFP
ncbi:MAG: AsmA family protein, partial [Candidatus Poribacteria bacterium]|nr:AsmA family protein [Candidatus Poribacteria bacterium]